MHLGDIVILTRTLQIESDVVVRARSCIALLDSMFAPPPIAPVSASPTTTTAARPPSPAAALKQAEALTRELSTTIQATEDLGRMEELMNVNDELTTFIARAPPPGRPTLTLQGLGLKWAPGATVASPAMENEDSIARLGALPQGGDAAASGYVGLEEEELPTTPRVDKGKARAVPEPEEPEKVLSPTLTDEDDELGERFSPEEEREDDEETVIGESPTDR
jgi:protein phosphatase 1 regulatory subunit 37